MLYLKMAHTTLKVPDEHARGCTCTWLQFFREEHCISNIGVLEKRITKVTKYVKTTQ